MESNIIFILIIIALVISNGFVFYLYMSRSSSINRFEQEKNELRNQNENLNKEIERIQKEGKEVREENSSLKEKNRLIKAELYEIQTKNKDLIEKIDSSEKRILQLDENLRRLNIELEDIKNRDEKAALKQQPKENRIDMDKPENPHKIIEELNNKIRELEKKLSICNNEYKLDEYKNNMQLYQNRIKILEDQLTKIKSQLDEKSREIISFKTKNENLEKAYLTIKGELAVALDKISSLKGGELSK